MISKIRSSAGDVVLKNALKMPVAGNGARVGLFGGSFNPPHFGHLNLCDLAFKKLKLDQIWWMVTPGNPLKDMKGQPSLTDRLQLCHEMVRDPRIQITAFEAQHRVRYTADTLKIVKKLRPRQKFVWLMGADNLANFHKWQNWREIAAMMPIAVIDRPGATLSYLSAPASITLSRYRIDEEDSSLLSGMKPPAWTFIRGPRSALSSTSLRERAALGQQPSVNAD